MEKFYVSWPQFGLGLAMVDFVVCLEAGSRSGPGGLLAKGAIRALRALVEPNDSDDLANVILEIGPLLDILSPEPGGAIRKLFRSIASGAITEEMLRGPVEAPAAPTA